jgi:hypothetical protein
LRYQIVKLKGKRFGWVVYSEDELNRSGRTFDSDAAARVDLARHYRVR